jgi:DNA-binding NtrC family response regulator
VLQDREYEPVGSSQTRTTKARVLAATNRDLEPAIQEGQFREDLYYRLNVVTIQAPPLCEHLEDLDLLVDHFIKRVASREGISAKEPTAECRALLSQWHWPGNVRELENVIESALIMGEGERLEVHDLPAFLRKKQSAESEGGAMTKDGTPDLSRVTLDEMERYLILQALERSRGNQSEAARHLGVTRRTLNYRREKYGI